METFSPIQGMYECLNETGSYVDKIQYESLKIELDEARLALKKIVRITTNEVFEMNTSGVLGAPDTSIEDHLKKQVNETYRIAYEELNGKTQD